MSVSKILVAGATGQSGARRFATSSKPATRSAPSCAAPGKANGCARWGRNR
jgi:hypothetical protein